MTKTAPPPGSAMSLDWAAANIRSLPPYKGPATFADFPDAASRPRLIHLNESPYPPSPRVGEAMSAAMHDLNRYPDIFGRALVRRLSAATGTAEQRIVLGCGSDELIHFATVVSLSPGDEAVVPAPSFPRYALSARLAGAAVKRVKLDPGGACDPDGLVAAIGPRTRLVVCCTPNPPSGGMMTAEAIAAVAKGVPDDVLLLMDEAYCEFGRHAGGPDVLSAMRRRKGPWLVTRTFSKAYACAALRVGYALCGDDSVAEAFRRAKLQFNVPTLSQIGALAAYEDEAYLAHMLDRIGAERDRLAKGLAQLGLRVLPSAANFVSCILDGPAAKAMAALEVRGIFVRDWRDPDHLSELRIGIGTPDDTGATLEALGTYLRGDA
ncbi:MAG: aminotransferase class I/II-fold pyridoxal phosphate-dependent enzyme [Alphaproteobacteria bacterium]|nr:aminotransferase class I/II-fold pyridoxal phosphate-dependent enzyme [Alphaproteobacteria bacterium]